MGLRGQEPVRTDLLRCTRSMEGFGGLAAAILVAMVLMVVVPALVLGGLAQRIWKHAAVTGAAIVLGAGGGAVAVAATFYGEAITRPTLVLEAPTEFEHEWVVLLEDPTVDQRLDWSGALAPSASLRIPPGGVVRVTQLPDPFRGDIDVVLSSGAHNTGLIARPAPTELRATRMVAFGFVAYGEETEPDLSMMDEAALVDRVLALEAQR